MAREFGKPIHQLPLIPANILKKHHVHEPLDPRFRSAARLLQGLWREERGLPIGSHLGEDGKHRKLGSRISEAAGRAGGNFLTPEIAHTARRETAYREIRALGALARTRLGLSDRAAAGFHRRRAPAPLRTFPWPFGCPIARNRPE
jgi:hypothetical protein